MNSVVSLCPLSHSPALPRPLAPCPLHQFWPVGRGGEKEKMGSGEGRGERGEGGRRGERGEGGGGEERGEGRGGEEREEREERGEGGGGEEREGGGRREGGEGRRGEGRYTTMSSVHQATCSSDSPWARGPEHSTVVQTCWLPRRRTWP